jgi:hypothetical protein
MADSKTTAMVEELRDALTAETIDLRQVVQRLDALLQYLCSPEGRMDANCRFVDSFFMEHDSWAEQGLPAPLHDIFADMAGALHDTCSAPNIARNFDSTPEQLLARVRNVKTELAAGGDGGLAGG